MHVRCKSLARGFEHNPKPCAHLQQFASPGSGTVSRPLCTITGSLLHGVWNSFQFLIHVHCYFISRLGTISTLILQFASPGFETFSRCLCTFTSTGFATVLRTLYHKCCFLALILEQFPELFCCFLALSLKQLSERYTHTVLFPSPGSVKVSRTLHACAVCLLALGLESFPELYTHALLFVSPGIGKVSRSLHACIVVYTHALLLVSQGFGKVSITLHACVVVC